MEGSRDYISLDDWDKRWVNGQTGWHRAQGDETLHKYIDTLTAGRTGVKVFFPLCGKAVDMKWLADLGHTVVGVEFSVKPIVNFFQENSLEYTIETSAAGRLPVYRSKDRKISIYQCDLFKFSVAEEGRFDAIWDTGSLVAINKSDRDIYAELMWTLMSHDCRYLLVTYEYNEEHYSGPPCCVPENIVHHLYGKYCDIQGIEVNDALEIGRSRFSEKFDYFRQHTYIIQPKI